MSSPDAPDAPHAAVIEALHHSDQRLVRTVDSLPEDAWREPSLLPGWSRAHVIAHLALNGEALAGALEGIDRGEAVPMYPSNEARDADIEDLAGASTEEIRERLFAATTRFRDAVAGLVGSQWNATIDRLPTGPAWPAPSVPGMRWREVEIHHADLGTPYTRSDWPADFSAFLIDREQAPATGGFAVRATDLGQTRTLGADEPVVTGTAAELGWWLSGRPGAEVTSSDGVLPSLG